MNQLEMSIDCNICLEVVDKSSNISITICNHVYHTKCLLTWISNNKVGCPVCRQKLIDREMVTDAMEPEPSTEVYIDPLDRILDETIDITGS